MLQRLALSLLILFIHAPLAAAKPIVETDRWYAVFINGQQAGHTQELVTRDDEKKLIITKSNVKITIKRFKQNITLEIGSSFTETFDHKPVSATSRQLMGPSRTLQTLVFLDDGIQLISVQGKQQHARKLPKIKEEWMTPGAASAYATKQFEKGIKEYSYKIVDATVGAKVIETTVQIGERENIELLGKTVSAIRATERQSIMPQQELVTYIDDAGDALKMTVPMLPGMNMVMVLADKKFATGKVNPQELLVSTLVRPDRGIDQPRKLKRGVYELSVKGDVEPASEEEKPFGLVESSSQKIDWVNGRTARVTVDLDKANSTKEEAPGEEYSDASLMVNCNDPKIKELAKQSLKGLPEGISANRKAAMMRRFVARYIKAKDLSVAFATASDVARTKQGDCTEHAVLLAAMLRAEKIPSRTITGLVYVDQFVKQKNVFGYHMWTQAWLEDENGKGRWVDLDAAIPPMDATHIALAESAMSDEGGIMDMASASNVLGRLSIKVIEP